MILSAGTKTSGVGESSVSLVCPVGKKVRITKVSFRLTTPIQKFNRCGAYLAKQIGGGSYNIIPLDGDVHKIASSMTNGFSIPCDQEWYTGWKLTLLLNIFTAASTWKFVVEGEYIEETKKRRWW